MADEYVLPAVILPINFSASINSQDNPSDHG